MDSLSRGIVATTVVVAATMLSACAQPSAPLDEVVTDEENERVSQILALFECEDEYVWRDQSYAYAPMEGALCLSGRDSFRVRVFDDATSATAALAAEVGVFPASAQIAVADTWYVAATTPWMKEIIEVFDELQLIEKSDVGSLPETERADDRDVCVGMIATAFDARLDGEEEAAYALDGYEVLYPTAVAAAVSAAEAALSDDAIVDALRATRASDPFAHDVWLSQQVSPLKPHCAHDATKRNKG